MTALTTAAPRTLAPTALDRALLGLSRMLARARSPACGRGR
ncbi:MULTISPECIES: hypothetical protein [unclassified Microbacterium]|nr:MULTISPECIES: hypothetical protein [unclassified Microbacterium]